MVTTIIALEVNTQRRNARKPAIETTSDQCDSDVILITAVMRRNAPSPIPNQPSSRHGAAEASIAAAVAPTKAAAAKCPRHQAEHLALASCQQLQRIMAAASLEQLQLSQAIARVVDGGVVVEGLTDRGIAQRLYVTPKTVETHIRHVFAKLELPESALENKRVQAVLTYLRA